MWDLIHSISDLVLSVSLVVAVLIVWFLARDLLKIRDFMLTRLSHDSEGGISNANATGSSLPGATDKP